jgi:hypothetical protein
MVNCLCQSFNEFVEVFFIQENFVAIVTIIIKALTAFSNGKVIIVTSGSPYIKKIRSALAGTNPFAINALHFLVIVIVRHFLLILQFNKKSFGFLLAYKYNYVFSTAKFS